MNHTADECYSKHGFPPWMKQKYKNNVNQFKIQNSSRDLEEEQFNNADKQTVQAQLLT